MSELVRFSVSLEGDLLERFGAFCVEGRYLYDHHLTKLTDRMIETQYSHATCVVSRAPRRSASQTMPEAPCPSLRIKV